MNAYITICNGANNAVVISGFLLTISFLFSINPAGSTSIPSDLIPSYSCTRLALFWCANISHSLHEDMHVKPSHLHTYSSILTCNYCSLYHRLHSRIRNVIKTNKNIPPHRTFLTNIPHQVSPERPRPPSDKKSGYPLLMDIYRFLTLIDNHTAAMSLLVQSFSTLTLWHNHKNVAEIQIS